MKILKALLDLKMAFIEQDGKVLQITLDDKAIKALKRESSVNFCEVEVLGVKIKAEVNEICEIHNRKKYKGQRCADCYAEEYHKNLNAKGVIYYCEGKYYWWYDNGFHYKTDKTEYGERVNPKYIPEWTSVCNPKREEHIKENCSPDFEEKE